MNTESTKDFKNIRDIHTKDTISRALFFAALFLNIFCVFRWANQPLLDQYSFRQSQTALTTYWLSQNPGLSHWFNYETPVFGSPWQIPMEFPFFQWIVAIVHMVCGIPIDPLGRCISGCIFYCCLWPLYMLVRDFRFDHRLFYLASALLLFSPIYIYWSRAFLIESTALLFSLLYLAWLRRYLVHYQGRHIILATLAGILAILVKVTTFAAFGVASGVLVVMDIYVTGRWRNFSQLLKFYLPPLICMMICFLSLELWLVHSDSIKSADLIGKYLTSKSLKSWNFGTFRQRISPQLWRDTIWNRTIPESIGSTFILGVVLVAGICADNFRLSGLISLLAALFVMPILIFTNLYIVHSYYAYGNAVFIILALSVALWSLASRIAAWKFACLCLLTVLSQLYTFHENYFPSISQKHKADDQLNVAEFVRDNTEPTATLLVVGDDWSPEVGYYAQRKAIYLPGWISPANVEKIKNEPEKFTYGGLPIAVIVEREPAVPGGNIDASHQWARQFAVESSVYSFGAYRVYLRNSKYPHIISH